ncbi:MAG: MaoC family dehydratase N-terminal domain-containing protein [Sphingomonas bacterium]
MTLDPAAVAHWQTWIGRTETRTEIIEIQSLRRYAVALGESLDVETVLPSLAHWACFLPVAASDQLDVDGHPKRGGFLPPVTLQRRMFAAADMAFGAPLLPGRQATRTSRIAGVTHKAGRSGGLVLVEVEHEIEQAGQVRVRERQTIVYRDAGASIPAVIPIEQGDAPGAVTWLPGTVDLFRFSAVTFNSHPIHYDAAYATGEEGYPGLVVQGPFTAARLFSLGTKQGGSIRQFSFRALAPLFVDQPVTLVHGKDSVSAIRCDGVTAMAATFKCGNEP